MKVVVAWAYGIAMLSLPPVVARAEGMGQGEASINVRSDVKVAIRGTGGTPKVHLEALGQVFGKTVPKVRACYGKLVRKRAAVTGQFQITVRLAEGKKGPTLEVDEKSESDQALRKCVLREFEHADYRAVPRPAAAVVTLGLDNSRAEGQQELEERVAVLDQVHVTPTDDGGVQGAWQTEDGVLRFHARAKGSKGEAAVTSVIRGLRAGYAGFLDCRRKSEKGGLSPAGEAEVTVSLAGKGKPKISIGAITIKHERAPICMQRAFRRASFPDAPAGVRTQVTVGFSD